MTSQLIVFASETPVIVGNGGVIQIQIPAHLGYEIELLVDAIKAQWGHGEKLERIISDVIISLLVDLKAFVAVLCSK